MHTVTITLNPNYYKAGQLVTETTHNDAQSPYMQSVLLNGKALNKFYFRHSDIVNGAHLLIDMGPAPNKNWGKE